MRAMVLTLAAAMSVAACGSSRSSSASDGTTPRTSRASNAVTAEEIRAHGSPDLQDVLRSIRPQWFRTRPTRMTSTGVSTTPIMLYVDGQRAGTVANLSDIPVANVSSVRFYSPSEAQGRFGMDNLSGAIEVLTGR
jgi:hypothetical protein